MQEVGNSNLALKVNILLVALDIDKTDLANQIGIDRTVVSKVLTGERKTKRVQKKISAAICARIESLFNDPGQPDVPSQA